MIDDKRNRGRTLVEAASLAGLLLLYSNGAAVWSLRRGGEVEGVFRNVNPALLGLLFLYARTRPGLWPQVGLRREGLGKSVGWGILAGLCLSGPPLLFFARPILLDTPLEYGPVAKMTRRELLVDVFVRMPTGIAILEELAFRGLLYGLLKRALPLPAAIGGSAAAFAGWHVAVTAASAAQTNLGSARLPRLLRPYVQPLAVLGGMISTGFAGVVFALVRERTGNLAGAVIAHWLVDGIMVAALWLRRQKNGPATTPLTPDP